MRTLPSFLLITALALLVSCNTATPENYFDRAVLNSNMLVGFAETMSFREMESPSATMNEKKEVVPQKRAEGLQFKIDFLEESLGKINDLKETPETKEMLQASKALYEYTLPVYKNEYAQLAKLYDNNAPRADIDALVQTIHDKYAATFAERYDKLIAIGKIYAAKNAIKVNWAE